MSRDRAGPTGPAAREGPEVVERIRRGDVSSEELARIGRDRRVLRSYEVRRALAGHPRTPPAVARGIVSQLHSNDLADLARSPRTHPVVRRDAERLLAARIDELVVGERVSLARRATRPLIATLLRERDARVLRGLIDNPRLREVDVARLAGRADLPPEALSSIAEHAEWGARRTVRLTLLQNSRTPVAAALRLVARLAAPDLRRLLRDANVPRIVRVGAERRLAGAGRPAAERLAEARAARRPRDPGKVRGVGS